MSRIGKLPIAIPKGVTVAVEDDTVMKSLRGGARAGERAGFINGHRAGCGDGAGAEPD